MQISVVTLFVNDVDRAIDFYTNTIGWQKTMDESMGPDMRWVTVAPSQEQVAFTLMKATPDWGMDRVGTNSGVILEVDDIFKTCSDLKSKGVRFSEEPRVEPWGGWAMFVDSEGNTHGLHSPVPAGVSSN